MNIWIPVNNGNKNMNTVSAARCEETSDRTELTMGKMLRVLTHGVIMN